MSTTLRVLTLCIFATCYTFGQSDCTPIPEVNFPGGRVVMSFDGNVHDDDDIVAMAYASGLWWAAGLQDRVVQIEYNNHVCETGVYESDGTGAGAGDDSRNMRTTASGIIQNFGYSSSILYDYEGQGGASTAKMAAEIEKSTASNPLWILAGGPMETVWRALEAANGGFDNVTIISHSTWNERHTHCSDAHDWNDIKNKYQGKGVFFVENCDSGGCNASNKLNDQNGGFNSGLSNWQWMANSDKQYNRWIHSRNPWSSRFDPSDAGMSYFLITGGPFNGGNKTPDHNDARKLMENPCQGNPAPVKNVEPNLSFNTPSNGASLKVGDDVMVEAKANDSDGSITKVSLYLNDKFIRNETQVPYQWGDSDAVFKNLKKGEYRLKIVATDNDGATNTETLSFSVTEDTTEEDTTEEDTPEEAPKPENNMPVVSIVTPQDNQTVDAGDNVSIDVSATDDGNIVKHQIFVNGTLVDTDVDRFTPHVINNIEEGSYTVRVEATDDDGAKTIKSINITAKGDPVEETNSPDPVEETNSPDPVEEPDSPQEEEDEEVEHPATESPVFDIVSPDNGANFGLGETISVDLAAPNGSNIIKYQIFVNGNLVDTDGDHFTPHVIENIEEGSYTVRAEATNDNGGKTIKSVSITVKSDPDEQANPPEDDDEEVEHPAIESPVFDIVSPDNGAHFGLGETISVDLAAATGSNVVKYQIFVNGELVDTDPENFTPYLITYPQKDTYTIRAEATEGNGAKTVKTVVVRVGDESGEDTESPSPNEGPISLSITPADGANIDEGATVPVAVSATSNGGNIVKHEIFVNGHLEDTDPAYFTPYEIVDVNPGIHTIEVKVTDDRGLSKSEKVQFDVSNSSVGLVARLNESPEMRANNANLSLRIAPNPVQGSQMNVFQKRSGNLRITNVYGTLVRQVYNAGEVAKVDVSGLAPGLYILESDTESAKFVIPE